MTEDNQKENPYRYLGENPTVDLLIINPMNEILLIKRSRNSRAHPGEWAFPGGFIDSSAEAGTYFKEAKEGPKEAALRELYEETNLKLPADVPLILVGTYVGNQRDPRDTEFSWSKSYAFLYHIGEETFLNQKAHIRGLDDAEVAKWFPLASAFEMKLAFDHSKILKEARLSKEHQEKNGPNH